MNFITAILFVVGTFVAIFGIAIDYLLPGASPGINLPQLLVVAAGLSLALVATLLRREKTRSRLSAKLGKSIVAAAIISLLTLLVLELGLAMWGMPTYFSIEPPQYRLTVAPWWTCGAAGCHYDYDTVALAYASGELKGRVCKVNRQGYSDSEDFILANDYEERTRILLLGDSMTYGMSADVGMSYAEKLSAELPQSVIWNTGIPGAGASQALLSFNVYGPQLRPQITILGFVNNDFDDNMMPIDSWVNALDSKGNAVSVRKFTIDSEENVIEYDLKDIEYYREFVKLPPSNELERLLGITRLGSLLLKLRDEIESTAPVYERFERRSAVTRQYLRTLRDEVAALGSELLVIVVPQRTDIDNPSIRFQLALDLLQSLEIASLNPIDSLDPVSDYATPPDGHWNNAGHQKVGALLSECVERFIASGSFSDCDYVKMPASSD